MTNWKWSCISVCGAAFLALTAPGAAQMKPSTPAKSTAEAKPAAGAGQGALERRVNAYYKDIVEKQRTAAMEFVAPESRNAYYNMDYHDVAGYKVKAIEVSKDGKTASVSLVRTTSVPAFPQPMDFDEKDTWKQVGGQWYIVLPAAAAQARSGAEPGPQATADSKVKAQMEQAQKNIDPAEYIYALQNAMATQKTKEKPATKKPETKKNGTDKKPIPQPND